MSKNSLRFGVLMLVLGLSLFSVSLISAAEQPISPKLQVALEDGDFAWRTGAGELTVWVYFQDKGLQGSALDEALNAAEKQLSQRTAWRRAKVKTQGERLVDGGDLPVHRAYLDAVTDLGAELRRESRWLNAASFTMSDDQVRRVSALPFVKKMDLVAKFRRDPIPVTDDLPQREPVEKSSRWTVDYGANLAAMEQAGVPAVHEMGITGQGVIIGMLDTGFHVAHEALSGANVLATYDFVNDDENVDNEPGDPSDSRDHGTMTMSTAVGNMPGELVAPAFGASVVLAKTEDVSQEVPIEEDHWVAGLEWVETMGVDIVSSSLGYYDWYSWSDMDGNTAVTTIAADLAAGRGIVVVNSAGNERGNSWDHIIAPADGDSVITVGAVTSSGNYSSFSSPGPSYDGRIKPDVAALGSSNTVANPNDDSGYVTASGTSFSCPLTSGVAALVLSRAPDLTPMQVREALRETASMAGNPNNDYGWGIINAYEAVQYFGPSLDHTPLTDTESTGTPYLVSALVTDRLGLGQVSLDYRLDGGTWVSLDMTLSAQEDIYTAEIPGQSAGVQIDYFLSATSTNGVTTNLPSFAPDDFFTFRVGPDVTPPNLDHLALGDQALIVWPPLVSAEADDNLGLDSVALVFQQNGGPVQGPFNLVDDGQGTFSSDFPLDSTQLIVGDGISYTLTATDQAGSPNQTVSGPHSFTIIDALGVVLILEDGSTSAVAVDQKFGLDKKAMVPSEGGRSAASSIATWLTDAGYVADVINSAGVTVADFQGYQAVVLSAGDASDPVSDAATRQALQDWAAQGGKILIEGGEVGYDALSSPGYPDFAAEVLHAVDWGGDSAGDLEIVFGQENHPVLNTPHAIDPILDISYGSYGDEDAVQPDGQALVIMGTDVYPTYAGVMVYDDNPAPQSGQIVFFAFNIEAVVGQGGQQLTLNTLRYLLAAEAPATASLSGTVHLAGQSDHSGVLVSVGGGLSTVTDSQGHWTVPDLYGALYTLTFSKTGWGTAVLDADLLDNQHLTGLDVTLMPVVQTDYAIAPGQAIPDNSPAGLSSLIVVPEAESGMLSGVTVDIDISHSWIGDLTVQLISPNGTLVQLHDRSGSNNDDIVGNWPETLEVAGPVNLDELIGENNAGTWALLVADHVGSDTGILNSWGLHFLIPGQVSAVGDDDLPRITRLNPNVPNPFNPATRISFDLARGGQVQLGIFDLRGHHVRQLIAEDMPAGSHSVRWDGLDDGGRSVSSGVYLYRLESTSGVQERKMVLVR